MKGRLLWKLLGINVLVIGVVILAVWLTIDYLAAKYFMALMKDYNIEPVAVHQMFLDASHRSLIWGSLAALALAVILNLLLTRKVLNPLSQMIGITGEIAAGEYTARVRIFSRDEVGQLAAAFNRMANSLQRIEKLRKTMVIDVAHELRTPLTNMRGYLEALNDGVMTPSKEIFKLLHEETLRLAKLVEDLLQLARADASWGTLRRDRIDLKELTGEVMESFQTMFAAKRIVVETDFSEVDGRILADQEKLFQVFRNLLQNAWQYTLHGGKVRILAERLPGKIKMNFVNTGEGISGDDLPFIFERFYRGEKSRSREHGGAGIGLAIMKELIEAHGGEVGAESSPGETRVWFTLPA
ncbi:MAG: HAMP domain-containing protein [Candidatus Tectomicrobia bacterium]|uniref:histidine kinase n=1 Tax=Tectimicrobiota bacterium TaxID=2528274 RepID=A0A932GS79_UNCTE|nr:HAMP domain-containing protein [Candidatus Tectomicrobia bacterium]